MIHKLRDLGEFVLIRSTVLEWKRCYRRVSQCMCRHLTLLSCPTTRTQLKPKLTTSSPVLLMQRVIMVRSFRQLLKNSSRTTLNLYSPHVALPVDLASYAFFHSSLTKLVRYNHLLPATPPTHWPLISSENQSLHPPDPISLPRPEARPQPNQKT